MFIVVEAISCMYPNTRRLLLLLDLPSSSSSNRQFHCDPGNRHCSLAKLTCGPSPRNDRNGHATETWTCPSTWTANENRASSRRSANVNRVSANETVTSIWTSLGICWKRRESKVSPVISGEFKSQRNSLGSRSGPRARVLSDRLGLGARTIA